MIEILDILFILSFLGYHITNKRPAKYYWKSKFDSFIPLVPHFVVFYISFLPLIIITWIVMSKTVYFAQFLLTVIICNSASSLFWFLFPNGVNRPKAPQGISGRILDFIYKNDKDTNGFPSGHVFLSIICTFFLTLIYPELRLLLIIFGGLIAISTVFTKQHHLVDVFGGIIFSIFSLLLGSTLI